MTNSRLSKTEQELLETIIELLVDTEPETPVELDADLREMGFDPEAMNARIEAVIQGAWDKSPYNWRVQERNKIDKERERYNKSKTTQAANPADIRRRLQELMEQHSSRFATAHRNLDEISDEDAASLLRQYEFLANDNLEEE